MSTEESGQQLSDGSGIFSERHLLIELHQFVGERWVETHRWNHGLAEELVEENEYEHTHGTTKWTKAHLPSISVFGMMLLRQQLKEEYVLLDPAISGQSGAALEEVATSVLQRLIGSGAVDPSQTDTAVTQLREHMSMRRAAVAGRAPTKIKPITHDSRERRPRANSLDDALRAEDDEEVMHVLVDSASWLTRTVVALVRLREPIATELEEKRATRHTRFVVLVLGPRHEHAKRVQIGVALGALLQDDSIVRTAYAASSAADLFAAFDARLEDLHVMPQTARPTGAGVRKRLNALSKSLSEAQDAKQEPAELLRRVARSNSTVNRLGAGRPTQQSKWNRRARAKNLEAGRDDMPHKDCLP